MAADNETYRTTATSHIRHLSTLSTRLTPILNSAATTISQLTNSPIPSGSLTADTPEDRRSAISASAYEYFTAVFNLGNDLHKQVADLEEAGVVAAEEVRYIARTDEGQNASILAQPGMAPGPQTRAKDTEATVTNGGLGDFDVGVLNSRAAVRENGEDEILERVKQLLKDLQPRTEGGDEDEKMKTT